VGKLKYEKFLKNFLIELIETPSLSGEERELAMKIRDKLIEIGVDRVEIDRYGSVMATIRGRGELNVLFEGHMDHVPPGNLEAWRYPPYKAKIIDGNVYGRGAVDMKGPIASLITAIQEISKVEREVNIQLAFVVHEETVEGEAIKRIIEEEKALSKPDIAILIEPTDLNIAVGHRGRSLIKVELKGKTAHASMPNLGLNALEAAAKYIVKIIELNKHLPKHEILGKATITPVKVECEPKGLPQLPDKAEIIFDRRIILNEDKNKVIKQLYDVMLEMIERGEVLDGQVNVLSEKVKCWTGESMIVEDYFPGWLTPIDYLNMIGLKEILRDLEKEYVIWDFSTDGVYTANANIKTFGFGPGDWKLAHQPNENISLIDVERAVEGYKKIIEKIEEFNFKTQ